MSWLAPIVTYLRIPFHRFVKRQSHTYTKHVRGRNLQEWAHLSFWNFTTQLENWLNIFISKLTCFLAIYQLTDGNFLLKCHISFVSFTNSQWLRTFFIRFKSSFENGKTFSYLLNNSFFFVSSVALCWFRFAQASSYFL